MKIRHLLLDFEGIQKNLKLLDDPNKLAIVMIRAAEVASMTALSWSFQKYLPQGLTVTVYLAESHLLISTTPENKECNIDVSVCKESSDLEAYRDTISQNQAKLKYAEGFIATFKALIADLKILKDNKNKPLIEAGASTRWFKSVANSDNYAVVLNRFKSSNDKYQKFDWRS